MYTYLYIKYINKLNIDIIILQVKSVWFINLLFSQFLILSYYKLFIFLGAILYRITNISN